MIGSSASGVLIFLQRRCEFSLCSNDSSICKEVSCQFLLSSCLRLFLNVVFAAVPRAGQCSSGLIGFLFDIDSCIVSFVDCPFETMSGWWVSSLGFLAEIVQ